MQASFSVISGYNVDCASGTGSPPILMDASPRLDIRTDSENKTVIALGGDWLLGHERPSLEDTAGQLATGHAVEFDTSDLGEWDTALITGLISLRKAAPDADINWDSLPSGAVRLIHLAFTVEEREGARKISEREQFLTMVGNATIEIVTSMRDVIAFIGELTLSFGRLIRGKANYLKSDLWVVIQEAGAESLPIVSLISFLIGMIFAFVGVMQLENFGAGIYTANLVAVAMVREMAPIMTAIIMAGRTGAAYAAQIGTMKVNEELDALTTLGINPIDFLALPRVFALVIMMPLLTMYASLMGILGGLVVGVTMLDVTIIQYLTQTEAAVGLNTLFGGLFKATVFGALVAISGCLQGMNCGNNAMAVGQATTKAVVMGIVLIVVAAAILTVIYINLGI